MTSPGLRVPVRPHLARTAWGLHVAYRRLGLNQLNGHSMQPWQWTVATALTLSGRVAVLGAVGAAGLLLRFTQTALAPSAPAVGTATWLLLLVAVLVPFAAVTPDSALRLRDVTDRDVLRTLGPLSSREYVAITLIIPRVLETITLVVATTVLMLAWHGPGTLAAITVVVVAGGTACGTTLAAGLLAAAALTPAVADRARGLIVAGISGIAVGCCLGLLAPAAADRWRGATVGDVTADAQAGITTLLLDARPEPWARVVESGPLAVLLLAVLATATAVAVALPPLRRVADRHALAPSGPVSRRAHRGAPRTVARRVERLAARRAGSTTGLVALVVHKDLLARVRLPEAAARPVRRTRLIGAFMTGVPLGVAVVGATIHLHALSWLTVGVVALAIGVVSGVQDHAVPVAGIEAERSAWDLLRGTPATSGALLVAKAVSVTAQVASMVAAPLVVWCALLARSPGEALSTTATVVLLVMASGAGAILGAVLAHRTEGSSQTTVDRDPMSTLIHGFAPLVAAFPVVVAHALRPGDLVAPLLTTTVLVGLLVLTGVRLSKNDQICRRWR